MTNELAIAILTGDVLGTIEQTQEAVTMAVRALSQPDVADINVGDAISRQAAISLPVKPKEDRYFQTQNLDDAYDYGWYSLQRCIEKLPSAQLYSDDEIQKMQDLEQAEIQKAYELGKLDAEPHWIPFETRPLTEEEKEEHPEWDCILDCKLPDDGQRILVAIRIRGHEEVQQDEFYYDDGSYLDSGCEIGTEAVAWMPLPEPYKGETE